MIYTNLSAAKRMKWLVGFGLPIAMFLVAFPDYIVRHSFFWVCLATLPISIIGHEKTKFPFFGLSIACCIVTLILPTTIGIYAFVCCFLLFLGQRMKSGIHPIGVIHAFLASPFFTYISSLISFPIRLQLSTAVSRLLTLSGIDNTVSGNMINLTDHSFLVDSACAGMYLLGYGILFGTIMLSLRIRQSTIAWSRLIVYYVILLGLILWGNLVRIYFLVVFNIEAGHWMHEGVGLLVYLLQILVPFYFLIQSGIKKENRQRDNVLIMQFPRLKYALLICLLTLMTLRVHQEKNTFPLPQERLSIKGFKSERVKPDVVKLYNNEALVYVKSPVPAYSASHNPTVCWEGSGYNFNKIEKLNINALDINVAVLKKGKDTLHTAWWFESFRSKTGDAWEWRVAALKNNEQFYLCNLTCSSRTALLNQLKKLQNVSLIPIEKHSAGAHVKKKTTKEVRLHI